MRVSDLIPGFQSLRIAARYTLKRIKLKRFNLSENRFTAYFIFILNELTPSLMA